MKNKMSYFGKRKKTEEDYLKEYSVEIGMLALGATIRATIAATGTSHATVARLKQMFAKDCGNKAKQPKGNRSTAKRVAAYNLDGTLHKVYDSVYKAGQDMGCTSQMGYYVNQCEMNPNYTYKGLMWRRVGKRVQKKIGAHVPTKHSFRKSTPIAQYTKSGVLVKIYPSINQCCRENEDFNAGGISSNARGATKTYKNYVFKKV